ncbi:MAG TPA: hypothetical protein VFY17_03660 [Pilimelia sp.]|nr:hypothetical protein [Pilimelia sp.]
MRVWLVAAVLAALLSPFGFAERPAARAPGHPAVTADCLLALQSAAGHHGEGHHHLAGDENDDSLSPAPPRGYHCPTAHAGPPTPTGGAAATPIPPTARAPPPAAGR